MRTDDELILRPRQRILWEPLVSAGAVVATILGVVVPLFIHMDNKGEKQIAAIHQEMRDFHQTIQQEMKDFHGRMCAIEERRKG